MNTKHKSRLLNRQQQRLYFSWTRFGFTFMHRLLPLFLVSGQWNMPLAALYKRSQVHVSLRFFTTVSLHRAIASPLVRAGSSCSPPLVQSGATHHVLAARLYRAHGMQEKRPSQRG